MVSIRWFLAFPVPTQISVTNETAAPAAGGRGAMAPCHGTSIEMNLRA